MIIFDIYCENSPNSENAFDSLIRRIKSNDDRIKALDIRSKLTKAQLKELVDAMKMNTILSGLILRGNLSFDQYDLSDEYACHQIVELLRDNKNLKSLILFHSGIGDEGAKAISSVLKNNTALTAIKICGHPLYRTKHLTVRFLTS